jgi:hypothetical protein
MTDLKLAEEIERKISGIGPGFYKEFAFKPHQWRQIIAALRRGHESEVCPRCKGSGEAKGMTYGHGPDDYEIDVPCPDCNGTGERPPSGEMVMVPKVAPKPLLAALAKCHHTRLDQRKISAAQTVWARLLGLALSAAETLEEASLGRSHDPR